MKILFVHEVSYRRKVAYEMHDFPELFAMNGHDVSFYDFEERNHGDPKRTGPFRQIIRGRVHANARLTLYSPK